MPSRYPSVEPTNPESIIRYMPTEEQQQKVTVSLIALFRDAPAR